MRDREKLVKQFKSVDISRFPDFDSYSKPLERALWVLWVSKDCLGIKQLNSEEIAFVIRDVYERSITAKKVTKAFNRAGNKIHTHQGEDGPYFEVMREGKENLLSKAKTKTTTIFYFEAGKRFSSKQILSKNILGNLEGELRIADPYCSERTLDMISHTRASSVKILTQFDKIAKKKRKKFIRELQDFKEEYPHIEFRDYTSNELHDRYILSSKGLVILGHSIKDLGNKEPFAIVLDNDSIGDIKEVLSEAFNRRWKVSSQI